MATIWTDENTAFPQWWKFRTAHPQLAERLLAAVRMSAAKGTVFAPLGSRDGGDAQPRQDYTHATLVPIENFLSSLRTTIVTSASAPGRPIYEDPAHQFELFDLPECAQCVEFALADAEAVRAGRYAHGATHPTVACAVGPLLAHDTETSDLAFDFEGVLVTCGRVRATAAESEGGDLDSIRSALARLSPCARVVDRGSLTCAPEGAISKSALATLLIPAEMRPEFNSWLRQELLDAKRESDIVLHFKPGWCAGPTVANSITSGHCGGHLGDRRKKKGRGGGRGTGGEVADGGVAAPRGRRGRGGHTRGRGGGRGRGRRRPFGLADMQLGIGRHDPDADEADADDEVDVEKLPADLTRMIRECEQTDEALLGMAQGTAAASGGDGELEEDAAIGYIASSLRRIHPWFWNVGAADFMEEAPRAAAAARKNAGVAPDALALVTRESAVLRNAGPSAWVDLRMSAGSGSPWTLELFPCGCTLVLLACATYSARRALALQEALREPLVRTEADGTRTQTVGRQRVNPYAAVALVVDLACGTLTRRAAGSEWLRELAAPDQRTVLLALAKEAAKAVTESIAHRRSADTNAPASMAIRWQEAVEEWSAAMTLAQRWVATAATATRPLAGLAQGWYFARVHNVPWVHVAADAARWCQMPGRAEEIVTTAALTRRGDDAKTLLRRRRRRKQGPGHEETPATAAALIYPPGAWPCDAAWAASLAAEEMQLRAHQVGVVMPLVDSNCFIVFPGRRGSCLASHGPANTVDATPDGRDAYVAGAMAHALGSGQTTMMDCCLLHPMAFLVLVCGGAARKTQQAAFAGASDPTIPAAAARAWDVLIAAAVAFVSDACTVGEGTTLLADHARLTPADVCSASMMTEDDGGLFQAYRLLGRLLVMACAAGAESTATLIPERVRRLKRGIACAARPKGTWAIEHDAARRILGDHALAQANMHFLSAALRAALEDERGVIMACADCMDRMHANAFLVIAGATSPQLATLVLESISIYKDASGDTVGASPPTVGILANYHLPLSAGSFYGKVPRPSARADDAGEDADADASDAEEEDARDLGGEMRTPCLALLGAEFVKFMAEAHNKTAAEAAWCLLMELEVDARLAHGRVGAVLAAKWKRVGRVCRTLDDLQRACISAWHKAGGVPLAVHPCVSEFVCSSEFLPMADHPMYNPRAFPVICAGCGSKHYPQHRWDYPFAQCYPLKQGALMAEIVHAKAGVVVLPHATKGTAVTAKTAPTSRTVNYPVAVVQCIARSIVVGSDGKRRAAAGEAEGAPAAQRHTELAVLEAVARQMNVEETVVLDEGVIPGYLRELQEPAASRYGLDEV